jgi:hypothetical protein
MLAQDSATFTVADSFRLWINGLHFRLSNSDNTMLAFDLKNGYSNITVYFRGATDTSNTAVAFAFTDYLGAGVHHTRFSHDHSGSEVQKFIDNPALTDSLVFIQGMAGVNATVSFPGLPNLDGILINKAELEFFVAELPGDNTEFYPPVRQLVTAVENEEGDLEFADDVNVILGEFGLLDPFGGDLMDADSSGTSPQKYVMNVTASFQDINKGKDENLLFLTPFLKPNSAERVVVYGPGHDQYPARVKLIYTSVQ